MKSTGNRRIVLLTIIRFKNPSLAYASGRIFCFCLVRSSRDWQMTAALVSNRAWLSHVRFIDKPLAYNSLRSSRFAIWKLDHGFCSSRDWQMTAALASNRAWLSHVRSIDKPLAYNSLRSSRFAIGKLEHWTRSALLDLQSGS